MGRALALSFALGLMVTACGGSAGTSPDSEPSARQQTSSREAASAPEPQPAPSAEPRHATEEPSRAEEQASPSEHTAPEEQAAPESPPDPPPSDPPPAEPTEQASAARERDEAVAILRGHRIHTEEWATDFTRHTVPLEEFFSGGPRRDQILPLDEPRFETVEAAAAILKPREPVVELVIGDDARAYPLRIMIWHEIVNDVVGDRPVSITFCPLCNTALVFDRILNGRLLDFGTTGNLRNSDLVMWDRQTESWWQQFGGEAVVGELAGEKLTQVPARITSWDDFAARFPDGKVLSQNTGFSRDYGYNPYWGYDSIDSPPFFPTENHDDNRLSPKERVVFLDGERAVVIPFSALETAGTIEFSADGEALVAEWVANVRSAFRREPIDESDDLRAADGAGSARITSAATGELVNFDTPFWFAVAAFRPDAEIIR
ncbi:MAG: DUF3179 domain-containing protein [Actinomycetia bacterium]|nr:DUF3179 domain-containing protein [Actinomycetes bacterium]